METDNEEISEDSGLMIFIKDNEDLESRLPTISYFQGLEFDEWYELFISVYINL